MTKVRFYSDSTGQGSGGQYHITAGVAIVEQASLIREALLKAEDKSEKKTRDWFRTRDIMVKRRYLEEVLKIQYLQTRVFYRVHQNVRPEDHERRSAATLARAIRRFAVGSRCVVCHEGFNSSARERLRYNLRQLGLGEMVEIETGKMVHKPEIRLADVLANFIATELFGNPDKAKFLPPLPLWFADLGTPS